jgi:diaminopropionate ammonia-lyase
MQGYLTMFYEIFNEQALEKPTHIFIQCGNGSFPASALGYIVNRFKKQDVVFSIVEPLDAACVYQSAASEKREPITLTNSMNTIMAGLACGTPGKLAWNILKEHTDFFIKCSDETAEMGMRLLADNGSGSFNIISGESGAVTAGLLYCLRTGLPDYCNLLSLDENSKILLISTEGNTDPDVYNRIVNKSTL